MTFNFEANDRILYGLHCVKLLYLAKWCTLKEFVRDVKFESSLNDTGLEYLLDSYIN